jgi:LuxR family transcriptional regulator, maltose regulon positive regulatory protein
VVERPRLLTRLRAGPEAKLTLVAAPPGCGKTTLLAMWHDAEADRRPVGWVTLDRRDNDPVVLWTHILEALRRVWPRGAGPVSPEKVGATRIADVILPSLVNTLADSGDVALILDDFHVLSSGPARDGIAWLIQHAPASFQLVLGSRSDPGLPLGVLRARGQLCEVRAHELAFTQEEAEALLNGRLDVGLSSTDVEQLVARVEGLPAGLFLAGLSLAATDDPGARVSAFGGSTRHVVDFLVEEVLSTYDPAIQALMLRSSVLDRFCGSLCDALLEDEDSGERLLELSRTNLFLVPLDEHDEWYRFHHLFKQLLRVELEHRDHGLISTLHQRAFVWHRDRGYVDEAVHHALAAGAFDDALDEISHSWRVLAAAGRQETLLAWLERFPAEMAETDPALRLVRAEMYASSGRRDRAIDAIERPELSERELVILRMLRGPLSEREIGRELFLSHNTIHSHTRSIYRKLGVSSRADALRRGRALDLL